MIKLELKFEVKPVLVQVNVMVQTEVNEKKGELQEIHLTNLKWEDWLKLIANENTSASKKF